MIKTKEHYKMINHPLTNDTTIEKWNYEEKMEKKTLDDKTQLRMEIKRIIWQIK